MAPSTELQPSFEDVFHILSQTPPDKLLNLTYRLKDLTVGPSGKLLQSMVLFTLGQEVRARSCLVALGDNPAARYIHQTKLATATEQEAEEGLQPPQLDAGAMVQLAEVYSVLAEENLCSREAVAKARQAATKACAASKGTRGDRPHIVPPREQDRPGSALSGSPGERFQPLRSADAGFMQPGTPGYVLRSSPVPIRGSSELSGPRTLRSWGSPSLPSHLEISASPTVPISSQRPPQPPVPPSKPPPQQPVSLTQPPPQQPVPLREPPPQQPVLSSQCPPQQPVSLTQPPPQQPVPLREPPPQQPVLSSQCPPQQPVSLSQLPPQQPVPLRQPPPQQPVPLTQPPPQQPVPLRPPPQQPVSPRQPPPQQPVPLRQPPPQQPVPPSQPPTQQPVPLRQPPPQQPVLSSQCPPQQPVSLRQPPPQQPVSLRQPPPQQPVSSPGDRASPGLQESSWSSRADPHSWQDTGAQVPRLEKVLQVSSCHTAHSISKAQPPATGAIKEPVETSDVFSTEPHSANANTDRRQEEKQLSTSLPDWRAAGDAGPAHTPMDSSIPAGIAPNSAAAAVSTCSLTPTCSSSAFPPLHGAPSSLPHPPPFYSSPSPAWPPPLQRVPTAEPDAEEQRFFTFVVLHATEDEPVAHRVKQLLEAMGVPNGATLCGDFSVAGRSHLTCFEDAMENSAFIILLLAKHFLCNLCMFQTNTALMESILNPSKQDSVIPFVPRENPLQRREMPRTLSGLIPLDENSPGFSSTVRNTFTSSKIERRKAKWEMMMKTRNLQLYQEQYQASQNLAALNLGCSATGPLPAAWLEQPPQHWQPPTSTVPPATYPPPPAAQPRPPHMGPLPFHDPPLPSGHLHVPPAAGAGPTLVIQNAQMVQIGDHNMMQVERGAAREEGHR
ncbi:TIR domain-containing adapter molecule 1 [Colius striatus]|uniref:TIR domain-containing adapter molecule 1 n=1 Tax=Colius striatus TaxID=57412 RepID=UPI002B1DBA18|nr:TIR domain-containing adapter molecule 1 [Colius striatus]